ncbi:MAG: reverse transcriptase/maturase family protein, partial [Candidatus Odinarchaeia archaeon]
MLISEEEILNISNKLKPREKEFLIKNIKEIKDNINSLNLGLAKRIIIRKEKPREILIPSLESKILQYYLKDKLKFKQYFYSYAYKKGRGSIKAMKLVNEKIKLYDYALKLDVKDFFPSINHKILLDKIPPHLKSVIREIIEVRYLEEDKVKTLDRGLPLGNPLSGTLANLYLSRLDKKLFLKCKYYNYFYLRYADDFIILG